jgi:hypothetical protein
MPRIFFLVLELNYSEVLNKNAFTFIKMQCGAKRKIEREFFQIFCERERVLRVFQE